MMEIYEKAIARWGDKQYLKAVEEMTELSQVLIKAFLGSIDHEHIAEEIADVEIMLEQVKMMTNSYKMVDVFKAFKLERLAERLENEKECA